MAKFTMKYTNNFEKAIRQVENCCKNGLEEVGIRIEGYAAANAPVGSTESTNVQNYNGGTLRQSITHKVIEYTVYVGSNLDYAKYVENGTGVYADDGKGRKSPWVWKDKNGDYHWTRGIKPQHFLLKALTEHDDEYAEVFKNSFVF